MKEIGSRQGSFLIAFVALLCLTAWCLNLFAHWQFTGQLRDDAAAALALAATGETPHHWEFSNADDLIARHPFGTDDFGFDDGKLVIHSGAQPFEVGLRLERPIDLRRFPRVSLTFYASARGELRIALRQRLEAPEQISSTISFPKGQSDLMLDLSTLPWQKETGKADSAAPEVAAMLRLRFSIVPGNEIAVAAVTLQRPADYKPIDIINSPQVIDPTMQCAANAPIVYRLPLAPETQKVDIANIVANHCSNSQPLILLPQHGRVEQEMTLRNAVYAALPAAILIPEAALDASFIEARELVAAGPRDLSPRRLPWSIVGCYALVLLLAGFKPLRVPRLRALSEVVLVLTGPAWLILGGNYDGSLHAAQTVLIALTLTYAVSLSMPRAWCWIGERRAWLFAAAVVLFALVLGMELHRPDQAIAAIGLKQVARYFGWALLQQYLICAVCAERWRIVTGNVLLATYLGALGFALLHAPNAALMLATFVGGLFWCGIYLKFRALLPLAISHAVCALLLVALLPADILNSAEVSARFFQ